jgi:hypothetical protein
MATQTGAVRPCHGRHSSGRRLKTPSMCCWPLRPGSTLELRSGHAPSRSGCDALRSTDHERDQRSAHQQGVPGADGSAHAGLGGRRCHPGIRERPGGSCRRGHLDQWWGGWQGGDGPSASATRRSRGEPARQAWPLWPHPPRHAARSAGDRAARCRRRRVACRCPSLSTNPARAGRRPGSSLAPAGLTCRSCPPAACREAGSAMLGTPRRLKGALPRTSSSPTS